MHSYYSSMKQYENHRQQIARDVATARAEQDAVLRWLRAGLRRLHLRRVRAGRNIPVSQTGI